MTTLFRRTTALSLAFGLLLAAHAAPAVATMKAFEFTGGEQTFTVPAGVHLISVNLVGGMGGDGGGVGGGAAVVTGDLEVSPGETLYLEVGGNGEKQSEGGVGGFNGGGSASGGGGGGGASDIRTEPSSAGLSSLGSRLVIAAGGGGGGGDGNEAGAEGGAADSIGGTSSGGNEGGGAGTFSNGGVGGSGCGGTGGEGALDQGGAGGAGEVGTNGGGGGGGGYYGGGGGGAGGCTFGGGGGGGGGSLVPVDGEYSIGLDTVPAIEIFYTPPPTIDIGTPADGATYTIGQSVAASFFCTPHELSSLSKCSGTVAFGAAVDTSTLGQHSFTVDAEDSQGGTSTKTVTYAVVSAPPPPTPPVQPPAPNTVLGFHPPKKLKTTKKNIKVKFTFSTSTAGAGFKCKLDKGAFAPCSSPKTYKVKAGKHKFSVEAVNGGTADTTPATFSFKVIHLAR